MIDTGKNRFRGRFWFGRAHFGHQHQGPGSVGPYT